ncbi:hypothetical protein OG244_23255 [Streptomyces brevispora]|uniref:hypothetical protein n=1 Tax=Streptomyces brevispora TaxID=887462 RepID=UPI002E2FD836|nr:hypothetical protein [Streptomyces brevispora]
MPDTTPSRPAMTMREIRDRLGHTQPDTTPADRRTLTADEYSSAWHAVEGSTGEPGADPATVLAAVLRVLDINPPARLVLGTTDQQPETEPAVAALRDRIRRAVCEAEGFMWNEDMLEPDEYGEVADAVLAVLPAPVNRAPESHRLALSEALGLGTGAPWDAIRDRAAELHRAAAQPTESGGPCPHCRHISCRHRTPCNAILSATSITVQRCPCTGQPAADQPDTETEAAK